MKLTNKILLVFLILLVLLVTAYKIIFNSIVELIPSATDKKAEYIYRMLPLTEMPIKVIEIKGRFIVEFIKSDSVLAAINGPDNLVNNYIVVERKGNKMLIRSKIDLTNYYHPISIRFNMKNLRMIALSNGTVASMEKFYGDSLNITLEDSTIFNAASSKIIQTNITCWKTSTAMISKTKNATVQLSDESNLLLTIDGGEVRGTIGEKTDFGLEGNIKKKSVIKVKGETGRREK